MLSKCYYTFYYSPTTLLTDKCRRNKYSVVVVDLSSYMRDQIVATNHHDVVFVLTSAPNTKQLIEVLQQYQLTLLMIIHSLLHQTTEGRCLSTTIQQAADLAVSIHVQVYMSMLLQQLSLHRDQFNTKGLVSVFTSYTGL